MEWNGVMPAITTCFDEELNIDHDFTAKHVNWLVDNGCTGIVTNGSLGEGGAFSIDEKIALWKTVVGAVGTTSSTCLLRSHSLEAARRDGDQRSRSALSLHRVAWLE